MKTFPRWVTWLFLGFLVYILAVGNFSASRKTGKEAPTAEPAHEYPALKDATDGERWKKAIYPDYQSPDDACALAPAAADVLGAHAIVTREGSGAGAACGEEVTLTITARNAQGHAVKPFEVTLTLGEQKLVDGLLVGIKPGETRLLIFTTAGEPVKKLHLLANRLQVIEVAAPRKL